MKTRSRPTEKQTLALGRLIAAHRDAVRDRDGDLYEFSWREIKEAEAEVDQCGADAFIPPPPQEEKPSSTNTSVGFAFDDALAYSVVAPIGSMFLTGISAE